MASAVQQATPSIKPPQLQTSPAADSAPQSVLVDQPIIHPLGTTIPSASAIVPRADQVPLPNGWIVASHYTAPEHLLDLKTLETPDRLLAQSLTLFGPNRSDYATASYTASFNWDAVMENVRQLSAGEGYHWTERSFYVVIFRSQLQENVDKDLLFELDRHSHAEAMASGGLLMYWFGKPNEIRRNLATCIWRSEDDAKKGGTGPWHKRARGSGAKLYDDIKFYRQVLTISDGALSWTIEDWNAS